MRAIAATAARRVGERLRSRTRGGAGSPAAAPRLREHAEPAASIPLPRADGELEEPEEQGAPEAELDALRGALVRELDRLATDDGCSASFRRAV